MWLSRFGLRPKEIAVVKLALLSRLFLLILILVFDYAVDDYDTSAVLAPDCFNSKNIEKDGTYVGLDWPFQKALERSVVWDGVFFVRIAQCGYEYEQAHAFFPGLPFFMRVLASTVFRPIRSLLGARATLALSGFAISNSAFVFSALYLFKISCRILGDEESAILATVLFCINPASVFYSNIYTESLFSLCTFYGTWHYLNGAMWQAVIGWSLSSFIRSNGILNSGFVLFHSIIMIRQLIKGRKFTETFRQLLVSSIQAATCIFPYIAFQIYGYLEYCLPPPADVEPLYWSPRPWCSQWLPSIYGFVQSHYWGVGFLKYFQLKQIPNFFLASPSLFFAAAAIFTFIKNRSYTSHFPKTVGSGGSEKDLVKKEERIQVRRRKPKNDRTIPENLSIVGSSEKTSCGFLDFSVFPFVCQLLVMVATAFFFMNVQVATRFLSVSPVPYWFLATRTTKEQFLLRYFVGVSLAYVMIGTLLFVNFYPFT